MYTSTSDVCACSLCWYVTVIYTYPHCLCVCLVCVVYMRKYIHEETVKDEISPIERGNDFSVEDVKFGAFFKRIENEMSKAAFEFAENMSKIDRGRPVCVGGDFTIIHERVNALETQLVTEREECMRELEHEITTRQHAEAKLESLQIEYSAMLEKFEKKILLLQSENTKLRLKVDSNVEQKYRKALVYINQLQAKLSST